MKKCRYCGAMNQDDADKCSQCGGNAFSEVKGFESISTRERIALLMLFLAFVYVLSPWDILPFSFFDDIALVAIVLGFFVLITVGERRR
jgi:uncharacterized membrane protein YkvA (DUF1232 family)